MANRQQGFTLIEILITMVILGIILAVALPGYSSQVTRSRRSDCMGVMLGFAQAMEKHRAVTFSYAGAAKDGANYGPPASTLHPAQCPLEGDAFYTLEIVELPSGGDPASEYILQATPVGGQAGDGKLRINHLGQRFWDQDNDGFEATENTWEAN